MIEKARESSKSALKTLKYQNHKVFDNIPSMNYHHSKEINPVVLDYEARKSVKLVK